MSDYITRLAEPDDIKKYFEHYKRCIEESGQNGDPIFNPHEGTWTRSFEDFKKDRLDRWSKKITDIGWGRDWLLEEAQSKIIVGHTNLSHAIGVRSSLHRALFMIGIERNQRSLGFGFRLTQTAINWAQLQPSLVWIQLNVFNTNEPAIRLYQKLGFTKSGTTVDLFRVYGKSIDDTEMVLKIRQQG